MLTDTSGVEPADFALSLCTTRLPRQRTITNAGTRAAKIRTLRPPQQAVEKVVSGLGVESPSISLLPSAAFQPGASAVRRVISPAPIIPFSVGPLLGPFAVPAADAPFALVPNASLRFKNSCFTQTMKSVVILCLQ